MGMTALIEALVFLMVAIIVLYIGMVIWQPITSDNLYPLLENTEAFTHGATAVTLLQLFPLLVVAALFLAFFGHIRQGDRPQAPVGF